jgi:CRP/FNR family cyclic AMP-dependent transcriptional regulator
MSSAKMLKNIYLFKSFDESELQKLAAITSEKVYSPGQDIFLVGQKADSFYVISMGTVKIYMNPDGEADIKIANLGTGAHFGELPFLDGGNRSATAQATETSTLLEVRFDKLRSLLDQNEKMAGKFYRDLSVYLASRLRATTENLKNIHELRLKHF